MNTAILILLIWVGPKTLHFSTMLQGDADAAH